MSVETARSAARRGFLGDVITTAVEGGTNYWAHVSQYQYEYDGEIKVCVGERQGDEARATLHDLEDEDNKPLEVTLDAVAMGIGKIVRGEASVHVSYRKRIAAASRQNDAGLIDASDADIIVQAGVLGEVVYG